MQSLEELLKNRILASSSEETFKERIILEQKEYHKKWREAIKFFQNELNKERRKQLKTPFPYMAILKKLEHIKEIDHLRWFYKECLKYQRKKKGNSFGKYFWGSLRIK